jgi:CobQ-like glutamine amidotransferase family enzyme
MNKKTITILHLYPKDMNIYGDFGNVLTLKRRLEWLGYSPKIVNYNPGDTFPSEVDIIIGGGGQDSGQDKIQNDLLTIKNRLKSLADADVPMLMVCGLYQMFGNFFKTSDNKVIQGIGLLDIETYAKPERLIGNIITQNNEFKEIIGYENHSGQTFLGKNVTALAKVTMGIGNNTVDDTEGARYRNVIGTYLHGSLLPKNPRIADFLIHKAIINKYGSFEPTDSIDNHFTRLARKSARTRPR